MESTMNQDAEHCAAENAFATNILCRIIDLLDSDDLACHVVFVFRKEAVKATDACRSRHDYDLVGMNLKERAYSEIVDRYQKFVKARAEWRPLPIGGGDDGSEPPAESYYVEATSNVPFHEKYLAEPSKDGEFSLNKSFTPKLSAIEFRFSAGSSRAVFIKNFMPRKTFKYEHKYMVKLIKGYIDVEKDYVIELPDRCDCCVFGDHMLIFERGGYEDLFDHTARNMAAHKRVFKHFREESDFEIVDIDALETQMLNDPAMLQKFPMIIKKGLWNKPFSFIYKFLNERPIITVTVTTNPNRIKFRDSYAMIHFFNDAHLDSKATGRQYLASTKTEEANKQK